MLDLTQRQHTTQELGDLDGRRTYEDRPTLLYHRYDLVNDGVVFLAFGAVDAVVHVVAGDGFVGRDDHYVQLVDIPELPCLGLSGTGHTRELVVHTEVVLQGDGRKGLGSTLHLHVLFRLDRLVQTIAPTTPFHHTAGLLIDDLHFAAIDDVVDVFLEEGVRLEQLVYRVYALGLDTIVREDVVFLLLLLLGSDRGVAFQFRHLASHIRQDEEVRVIGRAGQGINTLVRQLDGFVLLVDDEIEFVGSDMHVLLVLLQVELFGLLQPHFDTRLGEIFDQRLRFRHSLERTEQRQLAFFFLFLVGRTHLRLRLRKKFGGQRRLLAHESSHAVFVFIEHLILATRHRTGDDQRRTGVINQHGVHLIDDREVMSPLYEIQRRDRHVITQVVKTELVVRTESDIASVRFTALVRVRAVLVDTIHRQAEEHINRAVPFGVTFGEVVVDCHHVYTLMRQGIEVHRQGCHKGLTFTGSHLRNRSALLFVVLHRAVQHHATEQLHVIVHHVPRDLVSAGHPVVMIDRFVAFYLHEVEPRVSRQIAVQLRCGNLDGLVLRETASRRFDDGKSLRKHLGQLHFIDILDLFLEFVHLVVDLLTFVNRRTLDGSLQLRDTGFLVRYGFLQLVHQRKRTSAQLVVGELVDTLVRRLHFVHIRLNGAQVFLRLVAE